MLRRRDNELRVGFRRENQASQNWEGVLRARPSSSFSLLFSSLLFSSLISASLRLCVEGTASNGGVATPLALQHARVFSRSVEQESEICGGQTFMRLRLHVTRSSCRERVEISVVA